MSFWLLFFLPCVLLIIRHVDWLSSLLVSTFPISCPSPVRIEPVQQRRSVGLLLLFWNWLASHESMPDREPCVMVLHAALPPSFFFPVLILRNWVFFMWMRNFEDVFFDRCTEILKCFSIQPYFDRLFRPYLTAWLDSTRSCPLCMWCAPTHLASYFHVSLFLSFLYPYI